MTANIYEYTVLLNSTDCLYPAGRHVACFKFPLDNPLQLAHGADYAVSCSFLQMSMSNVLLPLKYYIRRGKEQRITYQFQAGPSSDITTLLTQVAAQVKPHGIEFKMEHNATAYDEIRASDANKHNVSISSSLLNVLGLSPTSNPLEPGEARAIKPSWLGVSPEPFLLVMEDLLENNNAHTTIQPAFRSASNYIPYFMLLPQTNKNMRDNGPAYPPYIFSPSYLNWKAMRKSQPNSLTLTLREGGVDGQVLTIDPIAFSFTLQLHIRQRIVLKF